jgi:hypothetical protein
MGIMKKLIVLLAFVAVSATAASAQSWGAGGRLGSGFQAVGQKYLNDANYIEARFGMNWLYRGSTFADVSAMYVWNIANMDWTPGSGNWFFDLGAGANLGGGNHYFFLGVQGMAKLGYEFENAPVRLSVDWAPSFGPGITSVRVSGDRITDTELNTRGMGNFGLSCVYLF